MEEADQGWLEEECTNAWKRPNIERMLGEEWALIRDVDEGITVWLSG